MSDSARETVVETIKVTGETLLETLKKLLKEGNIRRIVIKDEQDKVLIEFPMTLGVIGAVLSPVLTVLATLIVLFKEYTITVERIVDEDVDKEALRKKK
ncbi:DUF4342 domain-containing protein [Candidatus Woesebacteria bacterium]|nr:DUF4342 domain-containing protein [Candidatus Woesebacteria bacterium]